MTIYFQKIKAINIRVFKWKESIINEQLSNCGILQCCIINEIMHAKRRNVDFLEASRKCKIIPLNPIMVYLPDSYESSEHTWFDSWSSLLSEDGHGLIIPETAQLLAETISAYLTSNYHATQESYSLGEERDYKVVVALKVYMKSFHDESVESKTNSECSLSSEYSMLKELICGDNYSVDHRKQIGPIHGFLLEADDKNRVIKDFMMGDDEDSFLNLWATSGDEKMIIGFLIEWLQKEPDLIRPNPEQDSFLEEVEPPLKIKKYDAGSDKCSGGSCAICLEDLREGDEVGITPCSHVFHCHSIVSWLAEKMTCPMCRTVCPVII